MRWHIIQGEAGCRFAVDRGCVAVVVDALRASATAAALLRAGAIELHVVREVDEAFAVKKEIPEALLFGERGGVPPEGFDGGNSPRWVGRARGKVVAFTTTSGAQRLVDSWGAPAIYMGTTVNASAVARAAASHGKEVVLIPAGLATDSNFSAQEDWVAATVIANAAGATIGEGAEAYAQWRARVATEGTKALFESAPHAEKLRKLNMYVDLSYCAMIDVMATVPRAEARTAHGVLLRKAPAL